uniref:phosphotransferase n=2 Tax=uncultured Alistipes sp. TaxID=538949 RepID=UPI0025FEC3B3
MYTLRQYLTTLADTHGLTRTLGEIVVCRDQQGRMCYTAGNSAVVFRIRHEGRIRSLRCYTRPVRHLPEIYGERFLPRELFLYTSPESGVWADVVLGEWIEGQTLHEAVAEAAAAGDTARLRTLSAAFDRMAATLTSDCWAHGDLKPENIIVGENGRLHLIDFDAVFLPAFAGEPSPELGTAAFQHPARTSRDFDAALDDYPAALISTALHALTLDPTLYVRYHNADGLLFSPQQIHTDEALREVIALFQRTCRAVRYRIARLLYAPAPHLFGIADLLAWAVREEQLHSGAQSVPAGRPTAGNARAAGSGNGGRTTAGSGSGEPRNALGAECAPNPAKDGNCGCEAGEYGLQVYAACGWGTHAGNRQAAPSARG